MPEDCVKKYFLKDGYRCNPNPVQYMDSPEDSIIYQLDVYRYAAKLIGDVGAGSVVDVGCGVGRKLERFIAPLGVRIYGIDSVESIAQCRNSFGFGEWIADDIESPTCQPMQAADVIICSDVVEHLIDPDRLFDYFRRWSHEKTRLVISTPDRDLRRGPDDMGPPGNGAHVREWNSREFRLYLEERGLDVCDHQIVELLAGMRTCQLAMCSWREGLSF